MPIENRKKPTLMDAVRHVVNTGTILAVRKLGEDSIGCLFILDKETDSQFNANMEETNILVEIVVTESNPRKILDFRYQKPGQSPDDICSKYLDELEDLIRH